MGFIPIKKEEKEKQWWAGKWESHVIGARTLSNTSNTNYHAKPNADLVYAELEKESVQTICLFIFFPAVMLFSLFP